MSDPYRIAIVGSGAIGAYYGAQLQRIGQDVHFLLRSDFETVSRHGLTIRTSDGEFRLPDVNAYRRTADIGACDLVIIALKSTANDQLTDLLPPLMGPSTALLTLQNGLGVDEQLAEAFGEERVMGGLCFVCLNRTAPGVIENFLPGSVSFAEFNRAAGERVRHVAGLFRQAGIKVEVSDRLAEMRWRKLVWNVPFNGLAIAGGGMTTDQILESDALAAEAAGLMAEIVRAAAHFGFSIPPAFVERQLAITRPMGAYKPSSLIDFLAGRPVEVEAIWGEPLRRATAAGIPMPRLSLLYALLRSLCPPE